MTEYEEKDSFTSGQKQRRGGCGEEQYRCKIEAIKKQMDGFTEHAAVVAFSGGVDSSLLLRLACDAAKEKQQKVHAIMLKTMLHPAGEAEDAEKAAKESGAEFRILKIDELYEAGIENNPKDRCYRCKKYLFQSLVQEAQRLGACYILEGTNADDLRTYRPGLRAVRELGIQSPLADTGFTKEEVRRLAGEYGISTAEKPSTPCLATRFPYGEKLTYEEMRKVEQGEAYLRKLGFYNVRLRVHKDIARIEVDSGDLETAVRCRKEITSYLKKLGYCYATLDLEGFRSGSMDETNGV